MKILKIILILLIVISPKTYAQNHLIINERKQLNLKGKVKTINESYFSLKKDSLGNLYKSGIWIDISRFDYNRTTLFNPQGRIIKKVTYYGDKDYPSLKKQFKYNKKGYLTKATYFGYDVEKSYRYVYLFKKDTVVRKTFLMKARLFNSITKQFNPNYTKTYGKDGELISLEIFYKNNLVEENNILGDYKLKNKYGSRDRQIKVLKFKKLGTKQLQIDSLESTKYDYKYNGYGKLVKKQEMNIDNSLRYIYIYKRNEQGDPIVIKSNFEKTLDFRISTESGFDNEGNPKYIRTINYEYDNHGNWIKKSEKVDGVLLIKTREIEYYKD